jgi:starch-binding outer membrane protein, SusD/RagB family
MKKITHIKKALALFAIIAAVSGCRKLIEVDSPQNQLTTDKVFSDTTSAVAALGNIYAQLDKTFEVNYSKYLDSYTDDLDYTGSTTQNLEFYSSTVAVTNAQDLTLWQNLYFIIYQCNDLIAQLPVSGKIPAANISQLTNEARFLRAYAYFYLVNLYGNVPLLLTTDVNANAKAKQSSAAAIYQQVISDLSDAEKGLPVAYQGSGRVRANKWAAAALLARVYLYQGNWTVAESEATEVINSGLYTPLGQLSGVFLAGSREAILQVWNQDGFVSSATDLIPSSATSLPDYPVTSALLSAFESGDHRKNSWTGESTVTDGVNTSVYYYFNKYKNRDAGGSDPEYLMVLRAGEQYLIRAEARAEQGKATGSGGAAADLDVIRNRAGLANTTAGNESTLLAAIAQEWRSEFFGEWGNRFLALKRTGRLNTVMSAYRASWRPAAAQLPIPQNELTYDPFLTQNTGY